MAKKNQNDVLLVRRYLLGALPENEQRAVEQQLMTDHEFFNRLLQTEEELIEEYVHGEIAGNEKLAFEQRFLRDPERQRNVHFERSFQRYLVDHLEPGSRDRLEHPLIRWQWITAGILACAVIILASFCAVLFGRLTELQKRQNEAQTQGSAMQRQNDELVSRINKLQAQLDARRQPEGQLIPSRPVPSSSITLVLSPGLERDASKVATANLSASTDTVRLVLQTAEEGYSHYNLELQTAEGRVVWGQKGLVPHQFHGGGLAITCVVPARWLVRSDYLVALSGTRAVSSDRLSTYYFKVVRSDSHGR